MPEEPAKPLGRADHLQGLFTGVSWYANFPDHYSGDARQATVEKGVKLRSLLVETLAEQIRAVKEDRTVPGLLDEFFSKEDH